MFASMLARARESIDGWNFGKCASEECDRKPGIWRGIRDREARVRLRGNPFCLRGCFEREMRRILNEIATLTANSGSKSRRIPLGLLMLSRGRLSNPELQRALNAQRDAGAGLFGEWLQKLGFANEYEVAAALSAQWSCPLMMTMKSLQSTVSVLPVALLRTLRVMPVHYSKTRRILHIAFASEIDYPALVSIERMLDCKTEPCITTEKEMNSALDRLEDKKHAGERLFENCRAAEEIAGIVSNYANRLEAAEVRAVRCRKLIWARIAGRRELADLLFAERSFSDIPLLPEKNAEMPSRGVFQNLCEPEA